MLVFPFHEFPNIINMRVNACGWFKAVSKISHAEEKKSCVDLACENITHIKSTVLSESKAKSRFNRALCTDAAIYKCGIMINTASGERLHALTFNL